MLACFRFTLYQPQDHFTRRLAIREIRLKDWGAALETRSE